MTTAEAVAKRCLYIDDVAKTDTAFHAAAVIEAYRNACTTLPLTDIPARDLARPLSWRPADAPSAPRIGRAHL